MATDPTTSTAHGSVAKSNSRRAAFWGGDNGAVWAGIDQGVNDTLRSIRVLQTILPGTQHSGMSVPDETLQLETMAVAEGLTKPYVELAVEFSLSNGQVQEPTGSVATRLAKFAARDLALAEDMVFLQGEDAQLPPRVRIESGQHALGKGLLGLAAQRTIRVQADSSKSDDIGKGILRAVMDGISRLIGASQSGPFFLIAGIHAFSETNGTTVNGTPTNVVVSPSLLGGSISGTAAMPPQAALLIATGADPTTIYVDTDPLTEPTHQGAAGRYFFRTFERVQYVATDARAFVRIDFSHLNKK
jgi:hypothetical protein